MSRNNHGGQATDRKRRPPRRLRRRWPKPRLSVAMILEWADDFHQRRKRWPHHFDGRVSRLSEDTWATVNGALAGGYRRLPGGSSLARLLFIHRGVRSPRNVPPLSEAQILKWARAHFEQFGEWPTENSGDVLNAKGETWAAIDLALRRGKRGLPVGSSLARLLDKSGNKPNWLSRPLTEEQVLALADAYFRRHGEWPFEDSGPIVGKSGDTWESLDRAFRRGLRGLHDGRSLVSFLNEHRSILPGGKRRRKRIREENRLHIDRIIAWGKAYFRREGIYPNRNSGRVAEMPGLTWIALDSALKRGNRGLPGGSSLAILFGDRRCRRRASPQPMNGN